MGFTKLYTQNLQDQGWQKGGFVNEQHIASLQQSISNAHDTIHYPRSLRYRKGQLYAIRNLLQVCPNMLDIVRHSPIKTLMNHIYPKGSIIVHSLLFDKTSAANFHVPFHQDVSMPHKKGQKKIAGVPYNQVPCPQIDHLTIVRIHLDKNNLENGPLQVIPESHKHGILRDREITNTVSTNQIQYCTMERGEILLMKPLLLHSSCRSQSLLPRRVIHLVFASITSAASWYFREPFTLSMEGINVE